MPYVWSKFLKLLFHCYLQVKSCRLICDLPMLLAFIWLRCETALSPEFSIRKIDFLPSSGCFSTLFSCLVLPFLFRCFFFAITTVISHKEKETNPSDQLCSSILTSDSEKPGSQHVQVFLIHTSYPVKPLVTSIAGPKTSELRFVTRVWS